MLQILISQKTNTNHATLYWHQCLTYVFLVKFKPYTGWALSLQILFYCLKQLSSMLHLISYLTESSALIQCSTNSSTINSIDVSGALQFHKS